MVAWWSGQERWWRAWGGKMAALNRALARRWRRGDGVDSAVVRWSLGRRAYSGARDGSVVRPVRGAHAYGADGEERRAAQDKNEASRARRQPREGARLGRHAGADAKARGARARATSRHGVAAQSASGPFLFCWASIWNWFTPKFCTKVHKTLNTKVANLGTTYNFHKSHMGFF
jgi:hypothetical protein